MIKARVIFKGENVAPVELEFAFPPAVDATFVVQNEAGERLNCKVEYVSHFPVNVGSESRPYIAVYASKQPLRTGWRGWLDWGDVASLIGTALKKA